MTLLQTALRGAAGIVALAAVAATPDRSAAQDTTIIRGPTTCVTTAVNGVTYKQCGDTWYRPAFAGTTTYVVVNPP
jgi:hypothetical protein